MSAHMSNVYNKVIIFKLLSRQVSANLKKKKKKKKKKKPDNTFQTKYFWQNRIVQELYSDITPTFYFLN